MLFKKILDGSKRKPNKIWFDKGSEFYNRSMKSFFQNKDTEMYSINNVGKYVIVERSVRLQKIKFISIFF